MTRLQAEYGRHREGQEPDAELIAGDIDEKLRRGRRAIQDLTDREKRILRMRFEKKFSADRIASELGLDGRRRVYTIIDRIARKLRRAMRSENES
jgi:DNA-directed RNA polymerase specialized sigma subunit